MPSKIPEDKWKEYIESSSLLDVTTGCWVWCSSRNTDGYGTTSLLANNGVRISKAHRVAYIAFYGAIPKGMCVCHACDRPECVNPKHLFLGTHKQNMLDRSAKDRCAHLSGESNGSAKLSEHLVLLIRKLISGGETNLALAKRFGVSDSTISYIRNGYVWRQDSVSPPTRKPKIKLSFEVAEEIRLKYQDGQSQAELARAYGVSQTNVSCIVLRKTWAARCL